MHKQTIAVDIDDVLAANAEGFVAFSNQRWGMNLTPEDYDEHWAKVWQVDMKEVEQRALELHDSGVIADYRHYDQALPVLSALRENYSLLAVTSRKRSVEGLTRDWIQTHYPNIFDDIKFAGIYDEPLHDGMWLRTKADVFFECKVDYIIDDQLKHCFAAANMGLEVLLYGDYNWNQVQEKLPNNITRVHDWPAIMKYFNARHA